MSDGSRRTSTEIREDIGRTRAGLDFMIEALEGRLSMGGLIDEAMGMLRGRGGSKAPLGELIREHPGPAALIAAGVVWLAIENRKDAEQTRKRATRSSGGKSGARKSASRAKTAGARKSAGPRKSGARKTAGGG